MIYRSLSLLYSTPIAFGAKAASLSAIIDSIIGAFTKDSGSSVKRSGLFISTAFVSMKSSPSKTTSRIMFAKELVKI